MAAVVGVAVFVFGAPPLILIPVGLVGATAYMEIRLHAGQRFDRHR